MFISRMKNMFSAIQAYTGWKMLLAVVLFVTQLGTYASVLAETEFTTNPYTEYETLFKVDLNTDSGSAFITTKLPTKDVSFTHKYESDYTYSTINSDILVLDYYKTDRQPVFRTWIYYNGSKPLYFHSVSFELDGKKYMFSEVGDKDWVKQNDNDYSEQLLIRYGKNNSEFFSSVLVDSLLYAMSEDENKVAPEMKMTLHGIEDIEVTVPEGFWTDFMLLGLPFTSNDFEWIHFIGQTDGNPCKVTDLQ